MFREIKSPPDVFNTKKLLMSSDKWFWFLLVKFNGLILLYCMTYTSISRVSGAYDHKMHKGLVLDYWKKLR